MEEVNLRFQHISEQIFGCLDNESFNKCLEVCRPWYNFLHGKKFLHARIILETVTKYHEVGKSWFQVFNKCNTKTIIDLRIAVEHLYQLPGIFASYRHRMHILEILTASTVQNQYLSPLHAAAAFGQLTLFNAILQRVENKFPFDGLGWSTLHYAAINDSINIYESIVAINGNILPHRKSDPSFYPILTPLNLAVNNNSLNVCRFIIENNYVPSSHIHSEMGYPEVYGFLHCAALRGQIEIYKIIMESVADKNPRLDHGCTPLHLAAWHGHLEICRLILDNVGDKNPVNNWGRTPRDLAKIYNHLEIVKLFS